MTRSHGYPSTLRRSRSTRRVESAGKAVTGHAGLGEPTTVQAAWPGASPPGIACRAAVTASLVWKHAHRSNALSWLTEGRQPLPDRYLQSPLRPVGRIRPRLGEWRPDAQARDASVVPGAEPRVLIDDEVWPELKRLAARKTRSSAAIAVPYVTKALLDLRHGDVLVVDLSEAVVAAGQTNPAVLRGYLRAGVAIFSSPGLHAKLFALGDTAVVGSANMSQSSEQVLRESVCVIRDREVVRSTREAVLRLRGPEITSADLDDAARVYRPPLPGPKRPKRPSRAHPAGAPPGAADRLWVIGLYSDDWPVTAQRKAAQTRRRVRRLAGRASEVEIGTALFDVGEAPKVRIDDVVIEAWAPGKGHALEEAYHPARVIDVLEVPGRGRSAGWVIVSWRRPTGTTSRAWSEVRAAAAKAGTRLGENQQNVQRRVTQPATHAALRKLWRYTPSP